MNENVLNYSTYIGQKARNGYYFEIIYHWKAQPLAISNRNRFPPPPPHHHHRHHLYNHHHHHHHRHHAFSSSSCLGGVTSGHPRSHLLRPWIECDKCHILAIPCDNLHLCSFSLH